MNHSPLPQPVITSLTLGPVELTVSALDRSVAFYQQVLGLTLLSRDGTEATLGLPERPLVALHERPGALPVQPRSPGLYHLALLLPTRADLSRWVQHAARLGLRLGQADHLVSEAFYLSDPDGHGIEVYRDRPSSEWRCQGGEVEMAGDPIDLDSLLTEPGADVPFTSLPDGTTLGHVHLRVADLAATEAFYAGVLGFDIVSRWPGALFVSVDGYHHHLGLNTWQSQGGALAPEGTSRLTRVTLTVKDIGALHSRLTAAGARFIREGDRLEVTDPAGNHLRIQAGGAA
ncbi:VOC family protein [Deinococcus enclensis]|uniref:Catechol 2,3-dioxygenase n=1 Tax=Deinococcus enclensis TaxID=1049582 RepID=A0ABT9MI04_9DEIO|nr:VOC family protein [Deinococcus enclensis]MDP9766219.1 catechol 2,3-dioxygenase [Deinococcus enclensis]